jgi:predicted PurR-regulated permease PerM
MESKRLELVAFSTFFVGLTILTFFVFHPFLRVLVLAAVLSVLFHPLYVRLIKIFGGGRSFVACLLVLVALVFLIIPILFFGWQIFGQAQNFFSLTQAGQGQYVQTLQQNIDLAVRHIIPSFSFNLSGYISKITAFVSGNLNGFLSQSAYIFFQIFFLLISFFFFLRDGEKMLSSFISLSPFGKEQNKEIIASVYRTITSVIRGTLFVGLIRFVLLAGAFYLFRIPDPLLWAGLGGIIGAVPGLGTPFVIVPMVLYLFLYGHALTAIGMGLFGILLIFFVDNMLSTYFFGKGLDVPAIFALFSILGGIIFFGPLGFIFGPIILSLFISAVDMYKILVLKKV